jgi:hypothetical protein
LGEAERKYEEHFLVFDVGGYPLAVRISQVERVLDEDAPDSAVDPLDLAGMLGGKPAPDGFRLQILIRDKVRSVQVDQVEPIKDLRLAVWLEYPRIMRRAANRMLEGFFFDGSRMIALINFELVGQAEQ